MARQAQVDIVMKMHDKTSKQMDKVSSATKRMSKNIKSVGKSMTRSLTLPLVAVGAASAKVAVDFDKSMRNVQSMGHQTESELGALGDKFKAMSMDMTLTTDTANGLAQAYYNIQSAGFAGEEGMTVLSVATKAATAGLSDTKTAAESIMGVLSSYGLEAKDAARVSDVMFQAVTKGMLTFDQLASAMPRVTGLANTLGVSLEELSAAFSTMSKAGVTADEAATGLLGAMTELKKGNTQLTAAANALGFASSRAMLEQKGLAGTMQLLEQYSNETGIAVDGLFNNVRAGNAVIALTGKNTAIFADDLAAMGDSAGATQAAFAEQMKSFSAQFKNFRNIGQVVMIDIGNAVMPVLIPIMEGISGIIKLFTEIPQPIQAAVVVFVLFAAALGPILTIAGALSTAWGVLAGALALVTGASGTASVALAATSAATVAAGTAAVPATFSISALAAAMWAASSPIMAVVAPIVAVGVALAGLIAFGPKIVEFGKQVIDGLVRFLKDPIGSVAWVIGKVFGVNLKKAVVTETNDTAKRVFDVVKKLRTAVVKESQAMSNSITSATGQPPRKVWGPRSKANDVRYMSIARKGYSAKDKAARDRAIKAGRSNLFSSFDSGMSAFSSGGTSGFGKASTDTKSIHNTIQEGLDRIAKFGSVQGNFGNFLRKFNIGEDDARIGEAFEKFGTRAGPGLGWTPHAPTPDISEGLLPLVAGGGGDVTITIKELNVPAGTPKEAVDFIWEEIGKRIQQRGLFKK